MVAIFLGGFVLYSASGTDQALLFRQFARLGIAFLAMIIIAQINVAWMRRAAPWLYVVGLITLILVLMSGETGGGAQRWLDIGVRFQPSELMKLAVPGMLAWLLHDRALPPSAGLIFGMLILIAAPVAMIGLQPDLGTAILIALTGATVIFLAGIGMRFLITGAVAIMLALPAMWYFFMHDYQKQRVLTLLDPETDPLGAGYHIIQSKIAIGSGGTFGKGWLNGSQGQLEFLPERSTDFIFAVIGEEFGFIGAITLLFLYLLIVARGFYIAAVAQDTFSRLLAGSISFTFFFYVFVNTAMVTGLLPVVGVPLPLVSAGGTSLVTLLAGFGILMSIQTHRKLLPR
ncbi:MAG: rod shape-determining protein RodA [Gammaproteobacteria bacterium]|nr:rod shape-determining protein RodA [Gammaproteobacteria bacterium]MCP4089563.1 rod shape-determining protein RodA [Gammaproteobacteria bacterium]MCP4278102.1 rod shape-determining protein RodA [Gammaproteobacteria bacterium]MCP4832454.1 rod shape-determining protein RodA [Gammaproteobacteria bacterium]MCP4930146.1 rod shape-determining protein RodA [Gammaproteobacteria bacterium]